MNLATAYREACARPSDIHEHLPTFVELVTRLKAKTIIELGTRGGVSTIAWLYGLMETGGHLWSVDLDPKPEFEHPQWTFLQGDDLSSEIYTALPEWADIVFIDTSHAYDQTCAELHAYKWKVRPGGRIVLHDTELRHPMDVPRYPPFPVKKAVQEFCEEEGWTATFRPNCFGIGIVQVPED